MSRAKQAPVRRGLVLGAGGVLGASWSIGALTAVEERLGWDTTTADVIIGTSAGSVLAAFLGSGVRARTLLNHQRGVIAPGDPLVSYDYESAKAMPSMPRMRLGSPSLLVRTALHPRRVTPMTAMTAGFLEGRGSLAPIGELVEAVAPRGSWATHPQTWIVAMDHATGKRVAFGREGAPEADLAEAVMASCSIPGWYAPVDINGRRYVDGGVCSPTSLDLVATLGLDEVVVISPTTSTELDHPTGAAAKVERYVRKLVTRRLLREAEKVRSHGTRVVLLSPGPEDLEAIGANLMDPSRRELVLDTSLRTSAQSLRRQLDGLAAVG
ncbi:MAG TPA: patatin-like phospholipase family protein [Mycobacteriales bacterium]|nr:patatin-like phospholipase family protein [Mycobacteriales bacterium]